MEFYFHNLSRAKDTVYGPVVQSRIGANRGLNLTHCFGLRISVRLFISKL